MSVFKNCILALGKKCCLKTAYGVGEGVDIQWAKNGKIVQKMWNGTKIREITQKGKNGLINIKCEIAKKIVKSHKLEK